MQTHVNVACTFSSKFQHTWTHLKHRLPLVLTAAGLGGLGFVWIQALTGSTNIAEFIGSRIVETGGYDSALASPIGWTVHLVIALQYAIAFSTLMAFPVFAGSFTARAGKGILAVVAVGFVTTWIANPAISLTISLLGSSGFPETLFPVNWKLGLPLYNHLGFFLMTLGITDWLPTCLARTSSAEANTSPSTRNTLGGEPVTA